MHPSSLEEAVGELIKLGLDEAHASALVHLTGPTNSVGVYQAFIYGQKRFPTEIARKIDEINPDLLLNIPMLNRRLRMLGLRILPVAREQSSARLATRACHGLRYLAGLDPSP